MDKENLRKVQLVQLEIAKDIKRVCEENGIDYYLTAGSCLGAVRHKGFIPWDDDLDIGMLRDQYEKFCRIAPQKLDPKYCFQNWDIDEHHAIPFGKVRKNGTVYQESKAVAGGNNGIYVDIIVYDNVPVNNVSWHLLKLYILERIILMKCNYRPWREEDRINWDSRLFYLPFQFLSIFFSHSFLTKKFEKIAKSVDKSSGKVYTQLGERNFYCFKRSWMAQTVEAIFEDTTFRIPAQYHEYMTAGYGDYMQLPPEGQRENRHQIEVLDFGE